MTAIKKRRFTEQEIEFIRVNWGYTSDEVIGKNLGRSADSIRQKRLAMGFCIEVKPLDSLSIFKTILYLHKERGLTVREIGFFLGISKSEVHEIRHGNVRRNRKVAKYSKLKEYYADHRKPIEVFFRKSCEVFGAPSMFCLAE